MLITESVLFVLGLVLLIVGYRRNDRNLLLAAAIVLLLAGGLSNFLGGFRDGFITARS